MIRVVLPYHLRRLAEVGDEVALELAGPATLGAVLEALETRFPVLRGAIRTCPARQRRPFVRYFVCQEDWSHHGEETPLPPAVVAGEEPVMIIGAMAGG